MELIQYILQQPLSAEDLKIMLGPHAKTTRIINYHELKNYKSLDQLFDKHPAIIIFRDLHSPGASPIGHWTTLLDHGSYYELFDSYGIGMDEELEITKEPVPYLVNLFKDSRKPLEESGRKLQSYKEDVNTCGRWAIARTHLRKLDLKRFYSLIDQVNNVPDVAVTLMTMLL